MGMDLSTISLILMLTAQLAGLTINVVEDKYISRKRRMVMLIIIILSISLIAQNLIEDHLAAGELRWFLRTTAAIYGYTIRPVFMILFLYIVCPDKRYLGCWGLAAVNMCLRLTAYFSHVCFWIDGKNHYQGGPLSNVSLIIGLILLAYLMYQSIYYYRPLRHRELLIPLLVLVMIFVSVILDYVVGAQRQPISFLTVSVVVGSVLYSFWLHLRFVREHEDDLKARQQMQILLSQIQPHFLYNTLSAIQYLCKHDPDAASEVTGKFSRYLQGNMSALKDDGEISFIQELEHTKIYLDVEQVRYEDALHVVYDIACTDFALPTLTLQPIVENAVRHGVRGKRGGGCVRIATREYPEYYEITVSDDGPGFDPGSPRLSDDGPGFDPGSSRLSDDGRDHIGIANVRDRLEQMSGGTLHIESTPGKGTVVTIGIPKKERT